MKKFFSREFNKSETKQEKNENITVLVSYEKMVDISIFNIIYLCDLLNINERDYENAQCVLLSEIDKELENRANIFISMHKEETLNHFRYIELIELIIGFSVFKFASNHYGKYIRKIIENEDDISDKVITEKYNDNDDLSKILYLHCFPKNLFKEKIKLKSNAEIVNFLTKKILLKYLKEYAQTFFAKLYGKISTENIAETDKIMDNIRTLFFENVNEVLDREIKKNRGLLSV